MVQTSPAASLDIGIAHTAATDGALRLDEGLTAVQLAGGACVIAAAGLAATGEALA